MLPSSSFIANKKFSIFVSTWKGRFDMVIYANLVHFLFVANFPFVSDRKKRLDASNSFQYLSPRRISYFELIQREKENYTAKMISSSISTAVALMIFSASNTVMAEIYFKEQFNDQVRYRWSLQYICIIFLSVMHSNIV